MAISGISMFFLSSVIFLLIEIFDPRIKTPSLFKKQVKLNIANILNSAPLKKISEHEIIINNYVGKLFSREIHFKNNIRKLRYEFLKSDHQIFLITSTQKGVGKTTIIEALTSSLSLSKKRTLIIDLNFGNNTLTQKYQPGMLIQDIAGSVNLNNALAEQNVWSKTTQENMFIIGSKEGDFTPSEALYNIDMVVFLKLLKKEFDFIIIEGAALNDFVDSQELAMYVESVFTIFSASSSITHLDEKSIKFISSLGEKNKGAILNNVLKENINF